VVFGVGSETAEIMFIGEAPGADEDAQGIPFVGRAGQLLTKIILAMGMTREEVYITNIIKCRPPQNRVPEPDEVANCLPYVLSQIELIQPKVIVALGATALRALLDVHLGITKMRGHWYTFRDIPIMPTFHPAYLLRNPPAKREVWDDMKAVLEKLGRKPPQ
jgi:DNA polymerase